MADKSGAVDLSTPGPVGEPAPARRVQPSIPPVPQPGKGAPAAEPPPEEAPRPAVLSQDQQLVVPPTRAEILPGNEAASERLRQVRERTAALMAELYQAGGSMDSLSILNARIGMLMDAMWPPSTRQGQLRQILLETKFEEALAEQVQPMLSKVRQLSLAAGTMSAEQLMKLADEMGMDIAPPAAEQLRKMQQGGG